MDPRFSDRRYGASLLTVYVLNERLRSARPYVIDSLRDLAQQLCVLDKPHTLYLKTPFTDCPLMRINVWNDIYDRAYLIMREPRNQKPASKERPLTPLPRSERSKVDADEDGYHSKRSKVDEDDEEGLLF